MTLLVGFDGSRQAAHAIEIAADLLPARDCRVVNMWSPPYFDDELRARLWPRSGDMDEFAAAVEQEGEAEARRLTAEGKALADAAGWAANVLTHRCYGDPGFELARLAQHEQAAAVVVGSRGLSGVRAMLGSTSDGLVHYSSVPVLVVPYPLLERERQAAASGPVLVGTDGSEGAATALAAADSLFGGRPAEVATVGFDEEGRGPVGPGAVSLRPEGVTASGRAIADALGHHARDIGASAIVVGSRGQAVHRELLLGSVAMAVLHHAHRPVLVVPNPDKPDLP
ncbi:MAG TPA: universal stress protein [Thermoleophilaceae bacterium]|nr:universal stress protein [Thermoleophilaceae bacterium]